MLDALGASEFSETQIKEFLSARSEINEIIKNLSTELKGMGKFHTPNIYTFGDTIVITFTLRSKKYIEKHIRGIVILMRRYLFHSMEKGILFRGSFSIGHFIEDPKTNTVMGKALSDAASWYELSDWMGLNSTPSSNSVLEYYFSQAPQFINDAKWIHPYEVPLKTGQTINLYSISWPATFFDKMLLKRRKQDNPKKWFLEIMKDLPVPKGTESKHENMKKYFKFIEGKIANNQIQPTAKSGG